MKDIRSSEEKRDRFAEEVDDIVYLILDMMVLPSLMFFLYLYMTGKEPWIWLVFLLIDGFWLVLWIFTAKARKEWRDRKYMSREQKLEYIREVKEKLELLDTSESKREKEPGEE